MIIVNQDRDEIINFDNIINIVLCFDDIFDDSKSTCDIYVALAQRDEDNYRKIGTYSTKERAQEVLNEITKRIVLTKRFAAVCIPERQDTMVMESYDNDEPLFIYQMPKE